MQPPSSIPRTDADKRITDNAIPPPSPDATPPFTLATPDDQETQHTNLSAPQTNFDTTTTSTSHHSANYGNNATRRTTNTITQFLAPQKSNQQPAIKRSYLQALTDSASTTSHKTMGSASSIRNRTSQPNPKSQSYTLIPQLDLSNHMSFSTTISSTWRKADELLFQTEQAGNVKIATWNSNHLTDKKAEHIAWYICATQIDIMFIQDTRLTPAMYKSISYTLKNLLGAETFVASSIRPHSNCTAGGQVVIINSALKTKIDGLWCDKTGLGLAMAVTIDTSGSKLQVLSTYWPAKPCDEDSGGLHNATIQALNTTKDPRRPLDFVQDTIARRIINHQENQNNNFVVVGDLNARWFPGTAGQHGSCMPWADSLSLSNYIAENCHSQNKQMFTRYSGDKPTGHIDHILTYGQLEPTAYGTTNQYFWRGLSDHRPLWAQFNFKNIQRDRIPRHTCAPAPSTKFDERDEVLTSTYKHILNTNSGLDIDITTLTTTQKDLLLEQICLLSVNIVEAHNAKHKKSKKKKDGWSPQYSVLCQQLHVFTESRRRLLGTCRRRKWTDDNKQEAFLQLILKWQQAGDQITWKSAQDKFDAMNATGHNPEY